MVRLIRSISILARQFVPSMVGGILRWKVMCVSFGSSCLRRSMSRLSDALRVGTIAAISVLARHHDARHAGHMHGRFNRVAAVMISRDRRRAPNMARQNIAQPLAWNLDQSIRNGRRTKIDREESGQRMENRTNFPCLARAPRRWWNRRRP